jgi:hypothetical protein
MQPNPENISSPGNRLASYFAVERKKAIAAACLVIVMGFMWFKLLTGKGEPSAAAASTVSYVQSGSGSAPAETVITYKEPPFVVGRNDRLVTDFFSPGDWQAFLSRGQGEQVNATTVTGQLTDDDTRGKTIRRIAEGMKLQIMEIGNEPQAFICDTLVKEGSTLSIVAGETTLDFKVLRITSRTVEVKCENITFELKLKEK